MPYGVPAKMLSQATTYAATALGCIAAMGGKPALVKVVAEACGAPAAYLAKIIHQLARADLVNTQRGVGGGVSLARPPKEISLLDICLALDDPAVHPRCMLATPRVPKTGLVRRTSSASRTARVLHSSSRKPPSPTSQHSRPVVAGQPPAGERIRRVQQSRSKRRSSPPTT